ncbi:manganese efflux pump [bacterium]|nr:manganese efflux pump [bacterium]
MNLFDVFILGLALGIDCLVVSFAQGICVCCKCKKVSLRIATIMGLFQGLMPVISYYLTNFVYKYIAPLSKPIVFGIFMFLGIKVIMEAFGKEDTTSNYKCNWKWFILLGVLTSIDAFGAGISLKLTSTPILSSALIIGIMSFLMSVSGFLCSTFLASVKTKYLNLMAGLILIFLAIKNLF